MPAEQTDAVSRVYAEALLGLAKQNNDVDGLAEEVAGLGELLDGNADLRKLIASPVICLLYTSPSPRDQRGSRMPSSA